MQDQRAKISVERGPLTNEKKSLINLRRGGFDRRKCKNITGYQRKWGGGGGWGCGWGGGGVGGGGGAIYDGGTEQRYERRTYSKLFTGGRCPASVYSSNPTLTGKNPPPQTTKKRRGVQVRQNQREGGLGTWLGSQACEGTESSRENLSVQEGMVVEKNPHGRAVRGERKKKPVERERPSRGNSRKKAISLTPKKRGGLWAILVGGEGRRFTNPEFRELALKRPGNWSG